MAALKSLGRKVARLQIVILKADKGKRFVVMSEQMYLDMVNNHVSKDRPVTTGEVRSHQRVLSTTAKAMVSMFGVGLNDGWRNHARCHDNAGGDAEDTPVLKLLPKVHKPPTPAGHPASRPVVAAQNGISSRAGDTLADFLEPLVMMTKPRMEDQSTEEVISQLEDAQEEIRRSGSTSVMVGSLNVQALYPNLDQTQSAEVVAQLVLDMEVEMKGINWCRVLTFVASNLTELEIKDQGLKGIVPGCAKKGGNRPGPTTDKLSAKLPREQGDPQLRFTPLPSSVICMGGGAEVTDLCTS